MIGILPCAGQAERFHGLPKYLLPIGDSYLLKAHVDGMDAANVPIVLVGVNRDNADSVQAYYSNIIIADHHDTMTQTVLSMRDVIANEANVLFGMPDTYFDFPLVYERLATRLNASTADVVLAVFKARPEQHREGGMVSVSHNQVLDIVDKPEVTTFQYIWGAMAWRPSFWNCLEPDMPHVGYGVQRALEQGLNVQAVLCTGDYWDVGTPERYFAMIRATTSEITKL